MNAPAFLPCRSDVSVRTFDNIHVSGELEEHMEALEPVLSNFLGKSRTAITGIGVSSLASKATLVEVEAVARVQ